jgi:hypothetical protein
VILQFKSLPTYEWLKAANIVPSATTTYNLDQLQEVAKQHTGQEAVWNCRGHVLNEVWWHVSQIDQEMGLCLIESLHRDAEVSIYSFSSIPSELLPMGSLFMLVQ